MKRLLSVLSLLSMSTGLLAQNWVEEGSKWEFYKETNIGFTGSTKGCESWNYVGDTLIESRFYQQLKGEYLSRDWVLGEPSEYELNLRPDILLRTDADTTWFLHQGEEHILANFNAQVGESWESPTGVPYSGTATSENMIFYIDSISNIDIAGALRPILYFSWTIPIDDFCTEYGTGHIVKGLFMNFDSEVKFILPLYRAGDCIFDSGDHYLISNYSVDGEVLYSEELNEELVCSFEDVGINSHYYQRLNVHPNPTSGFLTFELPYQSFEGTLEIFNILGQRASEPISIQTQSSTIELKGPSGLYLIQIYNEGDFFSEIILKQ
jgi:hypothetical protein